MEIQELKNRIKELEKEKEENKKIIKILNEMVDELTIKLEKYEQLVGFTTIRIKPEDIKVVTDKFISKDIIRNKIKELEEVKQKEEKENKDEFGINSNTWAIADWGIDVLKELLGE